MKIYYHRSPVQSYRVAAAGYIKALTLLGHKMVAHWTHADLVIAHDLVHRVPMLRKQFGPARPVILYTMWEHDSLPPERGQGLDHFQAIWTGSEFSAKAFRSHHENVKVVPHVVEREVLDLTRLQNAQGLLHHNPDLYYFFSFAGNQHFARVLADYFEHSPLLKNPGATGLSRQP